MSGHFCAVDHAKRGGQATRALCGKAPASRIEENTWTQHSVTMVACRDCRVLLDGLMERGEVYEEYAGAYYLKPGVAVPALAKARGGK